MAMDVSYWGSDCRVESDPSSHRYEITRVRTRTGDLTYTFSCAQSEAREKKQKIPKGKSRDTRRMDRFPCHGWLFITVAPNNPVITVKISHASHHPAYLDMSLPEKWKAYIEEHARNQTPNQVGVDRNIFDLMRQVYSMSIFHAQIWQHILREEAATSGVDDIDINIKEKSVYYYWNVVSRQEWHLADDPVESAREFISKRGEKHQVALLNVNPAPGVRVVAFQVKDFMESCGKSTRELAMDSTCKYFIFCCRCLC